MTTVQKTSARRLRKGFTLLEILITIAIMALLVGVVVGKLGTATVSPAELVAYVNRR